MINGRKRKPAAALVLGLVATAALVASASAHGSSAGLQLVRVPLGQLKSSGRVDERFQSYNVESVEVTGGNFWAPYPRPGEARRKGDVGPHGVEFATDAYQKREPIDLVGNRRLRMLTKALGPAYMRVSGSWANSIYFQDDDKPPMSPPPGYQGVMTRKQWAGVVDFGKAVDAKILTSFATSPGGRDAGGAWNPEAARRLFAYTKALGSKIDAVELTNEPNVSRTPYAPDAFARDQSILRSLVESVSPETLIVGPGSTGEAGFKLFANPPQEISTARLLGGKPQPKFDVFSYHFYGAVSQRCKSLGERNKTNVNTSAEEALSEAWLARADQAQALYRSMRDRFAPGAPIWITETAQTACGGDPWSSTFLDTFRYVDQLGRFARQDVAIVFHNTLAASDYALIDDVTWRPRPNYWAALLWRRLMGEIVLDAGANRGDLHLYAHCLKGRRGGVALVAINLNRTRPARIEIPSAALRYTLSADVLQGATVRLNGRTLRLTANDELPKVTGAPAKRGPMLLPPLTVTFLAAPQARNAACI